MLVSLVSSTYFFWISSKVPRAGKSRTKKDDLMGLRPPNEPPQPKSPTEILKWYELNMIIVGGDLIMVIMDRDLEILKLVYRFKFCLGRHIKDLVNFTGARACDRRLKLLVEGGYLAREKYLYGVPYLYTVTHKGRILIGSNKRENKIRLEQIKHDATVLDVLIYFKERYGFSLEKAKSERELHIKDGFGNRKHHPDFVFRFEGKIYAVEIELTLKAKINLEKNIRDNYLNYDKQIWVTDNNKIRELLINFSNEYPNIEIISLGEVVICRD